MVPAGEAGDVADVPEHRGGYRRPDPEDLCHGGTGGLNGSGQLLLDVTPLDIYAAQVGQELPGQYPAGCPGCAARFGLLEDAGGLAGGDALADAAGD